jgi:hypothetical protein
MTDDGRGLSKLSSFSSRVLGEPAKRVYELHLLYRLTAGFKKARGTNEIGEALRARDRHVEAIPGKKKSQNRTVRGTGFDAVKSFNKQGLE